MKSGDLIYCHLDDKYGIFLRKGSWANWITILSEGEIKQVQAQWWKKLYKI